MSARFHPRRHALFFLVALAILWVVGTHWNAYSQSASTPAEEHPTTVAESHAAERGESAAAHPSLWTQLFQWVNFFVILGAIVYAGKKYIGPFLNQRARAIQEDMQHSARVVEEATERLSEIEGHLQRLDEEILTLRQAALEEAGAERSRIEGLAQADAQKIVRAAEQEIAAAAKAARQELKVYTAELAVGLAEQKIQASISPQAEKRIFRSFVQDLGHNSGRAGGKGSSGNSGGDSSESRSSEKGGGI